MAKGQLDGQGDRYAFFPITFAGLPANVGNDECLRQGAIARGAGPDGALRLRCAATLL
jgi:hypothetical protein